MTIQRRFVHGVQTPFWLTISQPMRSSSPCGVIGLLGTGLMLTGATIALSAPVAQASSLQWQYDPSSAALSVNLPPGTTPRYFLAAQPARIVIDLPNTDVGTVQTEKQFPGAVQQIRIAQFQPGVTRIVMQLASGTVLAPQQVDLQQNGNQWVLRPVLSDANPAEVQPIAAQFPNEQMAAVNPSAPQVSDDSSDVSLATSAEPGSVNPTPANSPPATSTVVNEAIATDEATANLPPLEPGATEIPVELPPAESAATVPPTVSVPDLSAVAANPEVPVSPSPERLPTEETVEHSIPENQALAAQVPTSQASAVQPSVPQVSEDQAPVRQISEGQASEIQTAEGESPGSQVSAPQTPEISANETPARSNENPAEAITAAIPAELPPVESELLPTELPPATVLPSIASSTESSVNVPALNPPSPSPARSDEVAAIEFGQPLPGTEPATFTATARSNGREASDDAVAVNSTSGVLLPSGTVLSLRYQGEETLNLSSDYPLQEVLVVDRDVQDQSGRVIVPAGSQVIGRFETGSSGSEFIAQAISINGQSFLLNGRSDKLSGNRQPSRNHLLQNSAIGAVAGTLLGAVTGVGLVAGIAAGAATSAATTYLTAPQPAVIEPDRVVEVRLIEDLRQPSYGIGG